MKNIYVCVTLLLMFACNFDKIERLDYVPDISMDLEQIQVTKKDIKGNGIYLYKKDTVAFKYIKDGNYILMLKLPASDSISIKSGYGNFALVNKIYPVMAGSHYSLLYNSKISDIKRVNKLDIIADGQILENFRNDTVVEYSINANSLNIIPNEKKGNMLDIKGKHVSLKARLLIIKKSNFCYILLGSKPDNEVPDDLHDLLYKS